MQAGAVGWLPLVGRRPWPTPCAPRCFFPWPVTIALPQVLEHVARALLTEVQELSRLYAVAGGTPGRDEEMRINIDDVWLEAMHELVACLGAVLATFMQPTSGGALGPQQQVLDPDPAAGLPPCPDGGWLLASPAAAAEARRAGDAPPLPPRLARVLLGPTLQYLLGVWVAQGGASPREPRTGAEGAEGSPQAALAVGSQALWRVLLAACCSSSACPRDPAPGVTPMDVVRLAARTVGRGAAALAARPAPAEAQVVSQLQAVVTAARCGLQALQAMPRGQAVRRAPQLLRALLACLPPANPVWVWRLSLACGQATHLLQCLSDTAALLVRSCGTATASRRCGSSVEAASWLGA